MRLPVSFSLRNLFRRPVRSLMTVFGIAIVVFASILMLSLSRGLQARINATGEEENVILYSFKGENIMFSNVTEDELVYLEALPGVAEGTAGKKLISPEVMTGFFMEIPFVNEAGEKDTAYSSARVRGVQPVAFDVHTKIRVAEGNLPESEFEILVGKTAHVKLGVPAEAMGPGSVITFENKGWKIVGVFEAGGSLIESEIWVREEDYFVVAKRSTHTFVTARLEDASTMDAALAAIKEEGAIKRYFKGWSEVTYYAEFTKAFAWIYWLSLFMVGAVTVAGMLIGANTMYTAVINRIAEIGTERVLGFSRFDILASFMIESAVLSLAGGILGSGFGYLLNGIPFKVAQGAFFLVVDGYVLLAGVALALFIGILGALFASVKGLRLSIVATLRY